MSRSLFAGLFLMGLVACSSKMEGSAPAADKGGAQETRQASQQLAIEHTIEIDTGDTPVATVFAAQKAACLAAVEDGCVVLDARLSGGRAGFATLKMRASAAGIRKRIEALSKQGEISSQSSHAEDLAAPLADNAKKLAMMADYRSKLEGLLARGSNDIEVLMKLNRELAAVQSELETAAGAQAHMQQRVATEILTVTLQSHAQVSAFRPIGHALSEFGKDLAQGISVVITATAYLLPWVISLSIVWWGLRKLWLRRKRAKSAG